MPSVNKDQKKPIASKACLNPEVQGDMVLLDRQECISLGKSLNTTYVGNQPYDHIVIEDFLPLPLLRQVLAEFPERQEGKFNDAHSKLKTGYQLEKITSPLITNLISALNSAQFLQFLEEMTGVKGLIPDPYQLGGGLHETARGGHLSIHADFNMHNTLKLRRRMNLILFLNESWEESFGGTLELWEKDMSACAHSVFPIMGRAVVFNTDDDSFHGHPEPLTCPDDIFRRSLALYYYTAPESADAQEQSRTTDFRPRPGTTDTSQKKNIMRRLAKDLTPPILFRALNRK